MKQFELSALGLEEVSYNEAANINGGLVGWAIVGAIVVVGLLCACPTAAKTKQNETDIKVDAVTGE